MLLTKLTTGHWWLPGYNFAIKKEAYKKVGGFNQFLLAKEDTDLELKVAKIGQIAWAGPTVIMSGRRFRQGVFQGYWENIKCYIDWRILKKRHLAFKDFR